MESLYCPAVLIAQRSPRYAHPFMNELEHKYLPAILPTTLYDGWGEQPINWLDPRLAETSAYHPAVLISYYHWDTTKFNFPKDAFVFGDSGGYSIATIGQSMPKGKLRKLDPEDIVKWQIRTCTAGVILDVPPYVSTGSSVLGGSAMSNWHNALEKTVRNVERAKKHYLAALDRGSPFRWWGVAHGETQDQLDEWYERVSAVYPFDRDGEGWALKVHPANDEEQLGRVLHFVKRKGIRRAHFLQMTGLSALAVLFWLGPEAGLEFVSYDSASSSFAGINRTVYVPTEDKLDWTQLTEKFRERGETIARDYLLSCSCQSCEWARMDAEKVPGLLNYEPGPKIGKGGGRGVKSDFLRAEEYWKYRMIFHNTLVSKMIFENVSKLVTFGKGLDEWAAANANGTGFQTKKRPPLEQFLRSRVPTYDRVLRCFAGESDKPAAMGRPVSLFDLITEPHPSPIFFDDSSSTLIDILGEPPVKEKPDKTVKSEDTRPAEVPEPEPMITLLDLI